MRSLKMDWKTASSYYETRLSEALNVQRHALNLANLPQAEIPSDLKEILLQEAEPARRQLERLRKREFRIAVVGLEKAGKSTFINAWLECDLLPAKRARCTFTTTQIYSVANDTEQRLEVQVKTEEQFISLLNELETKPKTQQDIETIERNKKTLQQVRREGNRTFPFTRLEDIKESLKKYVADEMYAHSVLEARLYTNKLAQAEGIVFYDVPGLDSGLAKHVDEAQHMLSDCDAVILVQRFTSLREKELEIIKFTEQGDKNVTVADKLFVFLSHIDSFDDSQDLQNHIEEASQEWLKCAKLPRDRIVSGSARAYLILNGLTEKQTQSEIGDVTNIQSDLQRLTGITDEENLNKNVTGISEIKQKIFNYINTERVSILQKRCEASINNILKSSENIYTLVDKKYSDNPEQARQFEEGKQRILFTEWWGKKWELIKGDLNKFYGDSILQIDLDDVIPYSITTEKFKKRYLEIVANEMQQLKEETFRKRDIIFDDFPPGYFDPAEANIRWRKSLYSDITQLLHSIACQLAFELKEQALDLVEYMTTLLWKSNHVKEKLIDKSEDYFLSKLEHSLSTLFLRFARPVAELLIRSPLYSHTRKQIIKKIGIDIEILDNYYSGQEPAFQVLKKYANNGFKLLFDPEVREKVLGIAEVVTNTNVSGQVLGVAGLVTNTNVSGQVLGIAQGIAKVFTVVALDINNYSPQESVTFEVENDLSALEEYLRYAIFDAAGFESFCIQEFNGLINSFREKEATWTGVAINEWLQLYVRSFWKEERN